MDSVREQVAMIGRRMFDRRLTDIAGGNVSVRVGNTIYCSPRYAGNRWHWQLNPENIVAGPIDTDELLGNPSFTREGITHLAVYRAIPEVEAIIHAHPFHILPFCSAEKPIEPVLSGTQKYGTIGLIAHAPNYSQEQADNIIECLRGQEKRIMEVAAAVLIPQHGIFLAGSDLFNVLDALERINTNAWCIIAKKFIE